MADPSLSQSIIDNANGPKEAHGDSGGVTQHSLMDLIEADKYLAAKDAAKSKTCGLTFKKLIPPGTC